MDPARGGGRGGGWWGLCRPTVENGLPILELPPPLLAPARVLKLSPENLDPPPGTNGVLLLPERWRADILLLADGLVEKGVEDEPFCCSSLTR